MAFRLGGRLRPRLRVSRRGAELPPVLLPPFAATVACAAAAEAAGAVLVAAEAAAAAAAVTAELSRASLSAKSKNGVDEVSSCQAT